MNITSSHDAGNGASLAYPATWDGRRSVGRAGRAVLAQPNLLVSWAFYGSLFAIPFYELYVPGTGERLGIKRVAQLLMVAAMLSRPRVCLRYLPRALVWVLVYCGFRILTGLWLAPELSKVWWPSTLDLLQFLLPWCWFLFNVLHYPKYQRAGLWAFAAGCALCAAFHVLGVGTVDVDNGVDGRSSIFGQNANEVGENYALAMVALIALGLFRSTRPSLRLAVFPLTTVIVVALAKTGSRGGTLLGALGVLILLPQTRAFVSRMKRYVLMLLVAIIFGGVMYQIPTVLKRLAPVASASATQEEARGRMIPVQWDIFKRHPVFGSGPAHFQHELTRRAMPYLADRQQTISSHNLALLLLDETGIIGFVLFAAGLAQVLRSAWRARSGSCGLLPLAWLLPLTLAGLTISSDIFEPPFWLAIAYALAGPALPEGQGQPEPA